MRPARRMSNREQGGWARLHMGFGPVAVVTLNRVTPGAVVTTSPFMGLRQMADGTESGVQLPVSVWLSVGA